MITHIRLSNRFLWIVALAGLMVLATGIASAADTTCTHKGCTMAEKKAKCAEGCPMHATAEQPLTGEAKAAAEHVRSQGLRFMSAQELQRKIRSGAPPVIVDVLGAESYTASHVKGAINVPLAQVATLIPTLVPDKTAEIVVYCANFKCGASTQAAKTLRDLGYTNVSDYKGGLKEWRELSQPLGGTAAKTE